MKNVNFLSRVSRQFGRVYVTDRERQEDPEGTTVCDSASALAKLVMTTKKRTLTCSVGDIIVNANNKMWVSEVIIQGKEDTEKQVGERAFVSACRIMSNGQILKRSPIFIDDWFHP